MLKPEDTAISLMPVVTCFIKTYWFGLCEDTQESTEFRNTVSCVRFFAAV